MPREVEGRTVMSSFNTLSDGVCQGQPFGCMGGERVQQAKHPVSPILQFGNLLPDIPYPLPGGPSLGFRLLATDVPIASAAADIYRLRLRTRSSVRPRGSSSSPNRVDLTSGMTSSVWYRRPSSFSVCQNCNSYRESLGEAVHT